MNIRYQKISSPIGPIYIVADEKHLQAITFACNWESIQKKMKDLECKSNAIIDQTEIELQEYFAKERTAFDLPIAFSGTVFQKQSWQALLTIPYGETRSYAEQAQIIGKAKAVADINGKQFSGFFAWLIWSFVHILFLIGFRTRIIVMFEWLFWYITGQRGSRILFDPYEKEY